MLPYVARGTSMYFTKDVKLGRLFWKDIGGMTVIM